jgi:hypothetical protein
LANDERQHCQSYEAVWPTSEWFTYCRISRRRALLHRPSLSGPSWCLRVATSFLPNLEPAHAEIMCHESFPLLWDRGTLHRRAVAKNTHLPRPCEAMRNPHWRKRRFRLRRRHLQEGHHRRSRTRQERERLGVLFPVYIQPQDNSGSKSRTAWPVSTPQRSIASCQASA